MLVFTDYCIPEERAIGYTDTNETRVTRNHVPAIGKATDEQQATPTDLPSSKAQTLFETSRESTIGLRYVRHPMTRGVSAHGNESVQCTHY